jgi:hypothetical protein
VRICSHSLRSDALNQKALSDDGVTLEARVRSSHGPTTSVVVAWRGASKDLESLLIQLSSECEATGIELVLAHAMTAAYRRRLRRLFPRLRLARVQRATRVSDLRQLGAQAATGDILILMDDEIAADPRTRTLLSSVTANRALTGRSHASAVAAAQVPQSGSKAY